MIGAARPPAQRGCPARCGGPAQRGRPARCGWSGASGTFRVGDHAETRVGLADHAGTCVARTGGTRVLAWSAQRGGPAAPRRLIPFLLTSTDCPYVPAWAVRCRRPRPDWRPTGST